MNEDQFSNIKKLADDATLDSSIRIILNVIMGNFRANNNGNLELSQVALSQAHAFLLERSQKCN